MSIAVGFVAVLVWLGCFVRISFFSLPLDGVESEGAMTVEADRAGIFVTFFVTVFCEGKCSEIRNTKKKKKKRLLTHPETLLSKIQTPLAE